METALTALAIAVLAMLAGLVPYLGAAVKAALVVYTEGRHRAAINGAADTLAAVAAKPGASPLDMSLDGQVAKLRARLPDAMAALAPSDATLRDMLTKAADRVATTRELAP